MDPKILVFIPMYNCEKQIPRVLGQLHSKHGEYFKKVLIIDNGSRDKSVSAAREAMMSCPLDCELVQNKQNYNLGGSHKVAFDYCLENNFTHCVVLHGDDQGNIEDLMPQLEQSKHLQYDCVLGARFHSQSKLKGYSWFRTLGNYGMNWICSLVTKCSIKDLGSGLNIYTKEFLQSRAYIPFRNDLTFNIYLLFYSIWSGAKIYFFPLTWREEDQISNARIFKQAFHILFILWKFWQNPKKLFTTEANPTKIESYEFKSLFKNEA